MFTHWRYLKKGPWVSNLEKTAKGTHTTSFARSAEYAATPSFLGRSLSTNQVHILYCTKKTFPITQKSPSSPSNTHLLSFNMIRFSSTDSPKNELSQDQKSAETIEKNNEYTEFGEAAYVNLETGETGGPKGPEPTRFGDWERNGRTSDF